MSRVLSSDLDAVAKHLQCYRIQAVEEAALHEQLKQVFRAGGFVFEHEATLDAASRVDFLLTISGGGRIAIEVKVKGSASAVTDQLLRYAQHERVDGVLLVTPRSQLAAGVPSTLGGKPSRAVVLSLGAL